MGKNERFEKYFQEYKDQVIRFIVSKSGDFELAQEISQQVFCAFYIHMDTVEEGFVKAWLFRSAKNALVDHFRKMDIRNEVSLESGIQIDGSMQEDTDNEDCENQVIYAEMIGRILREVRKVNERFYEVLEMICVEEMSYEEAARQLNVSEQVVRTRLSRARKYVRERFGEEYFDS